MTDETKRQLHYLIDRAANKERSLDDRRVAITCAIGLLYDESFDVRNEDEAASVERVKAAYGVE